MGIMKDFKDKRQNKKEQEINNAVEKIFASQLIGEIKTQIGNQWSEPIDKSTREWQELYNRNPRMNPVKKIADTLSCTDIQFELNSGEIIDNEIIDFLENPNPLISSTSIKFLTQAWLDVVGECGWLIEKNGRGKPMEVYPIPPHWIISTPTPAQPWFVITLSEDRSAYQSIPPENFIYFKSPKLVNPYGRGIGNVQQIGDEIESDEFMAKYSKRFFYNDATPPMIILADGATEIQIDRLENEWNSSNGGSINGYKPKFLSSDLKIQLLKQSMLEMDFINSRLFTRNAAIEHFGIPKELFGITENSNRSTIDVAEYIYIKYVMVSRFKSFTDTLNRDLLPMFGETRGKLVFENILPEDKEFKLKQASEGYDKGALTINEWRVANGFEKLPGNQGEVRKTALNVIEEPVRSEEQLQEPQEVEEPITIIDDTEEEGNQVEQEVKTIKKFKVKRLGEQQRVHYAKALDRGMLRIADKMAIELKKYFKDQEKLFLSAFNEQVGKSKSFTKQEELEDEGEVVDTDLLTFSVASALIWSELDQLLLDLMTPFYVEGALHGFEIAEATYEFGISFDVDVNPEVLRAVNEWGLDKAKGINDTTKDQLRREIEEGIKLGESNQLISQRIEKVFNQASKNRSVTIARTEVHNAVNVGTHATYKAAGVEFEEWLAVLDERVRGWHESMDGQITAIDEDFISGQGNRLRFPGDPRSGVAGEVINCRCAIGAVFEI